MRYLITLLILTVFPVMLFAAQDGAQSHAALIRELHEAPSIPYLSEKEKENAFDAFEAADSVFVAKIENIVVSHAGLGSPVPLTRIQFSGVDVFYGASAADGIYNFNHSPEAVQRLQSGKVIALLNYAKGNSKNLTVTQVMPADKSRLGWFLEFLGGDASDPSCEEAVELACEETNL